MSVIGLLKDPFFGKVELDCLGLVYITHNNLIIA